MNEKPIVAISTPRGTGAVCIVRMSGKNSLSIAKSIFFSRNLNFDVIMPRYLYYGKFQKGDICDNCLMVYFKAPFSYTGEDIVEFQIHGGEHLANRILSACLESGCMLAEPGEFTKLAFLNGKISLEKAEGIIDTINAESDAELRSAESLTTGRLFQNVSVMQQDLTDLLAQIEVVLDYPEHDDEEITLQESKTKLERIEKQVNDLLATSQSGVLLKSGINTAIVGAPNAGKSSLLNALLGEDRAIVTDIAGTTRDEVKESITHQGIKINFIDTAGLRESTDIIEKAGIDKTKKRISSADLVLYVLDATQKPSDKELIDISNMDKNRTIVVLNKIDERVVIEQNQFKGFNTLKISAKKGENIEMLKSEIVKKAVGGSIDYSKIVLTNERHIIALKEAKDYLGKAIENTKSGTLDIVAFEIKNVWDSLGKITGETESESIVDAIFAKFCLGK